MIAHAMLHVHDVEKSKDFYAQLLAPLGYSILSDYPEWHLIGMGENGMSDFWIVGDGAEKPSHIAFSAKDKETVQKFHDAGLAAGGIDNGAPGYRDYTSGYYAAFVKDLDGHNIEAVFMDPAPSA